MASHLPKAGAIVMPLPFSERLAMLMPPALYYRRRIAHEIRTGEPELGALTQLVARGGTAIDVGANQGFYAFALSAIADRVVAFEPNPDYALFARRMLRGRAEVFEVALSDTPGRGAFRVPLADDGTALHFAGSLKQTHAQFKKSRTYDVEISTLDDFSRNRCIADVRFIKVDVEGSEREVLDGARGLIARDRPVILLELLAGTHPDPGDYAQEICEGFGYDAVMFQRGEMIAALPTIAALGKNTSWGTEIQSRNVLFFPR
jgi:FkbM family methyltransferase